MIDRYTLPEMGRVWSDQHKYELWCRVETLVLEAHAAAGRVPAEVVEPVRNAPPPTPERVAEIEETTQHDVIAVLTAWAPSRTSGATGSPTPPSPWPARGTGCAPTGSGWASWRSPARSARTR